MAGIFGIVNVTRDSFSDGGKFLSRDAAIAHGRRLLHDGASVLDLGAESTHPDAEDVPAAMEIERLAPVVEALRSDGAELSIDTVKPAVMRAMAALGVTWINDVAGMRDPASVAVVAATGLRVVVMFSRSHGARASRDQDDAGNLLAEQRAFFQQRIATLTAAGVDRERIVLDPGMGFFVGRTPEASLSVLQNLPALRDLGLPLMISVSRKSFLGVLTDRPVAERGAATLAAELFAVQQGADWIRTHDVRALRDGLMVWSALGGGRRPGSATPG